jgi:hypothetical protein
MSEYQNSIVIAAHPNKVFDFVADISNLPQYLPTVHNATLVSDDHIRVQGEAAGHKYDDTGYFRADKEIRKLEWGSDGESNYSGWLKVDQGEDPSSTNITVHISHSINAEQQQQFEKKDINWDTMMNEGISKTLQSIKNICEGHGGKVEPKAASQKQ